MQPRTIALILAALVPAVVGCEPQGKMTYPEHFVEVDQRMGSEYKSRAVSADGVVIALRTRRNDPKGSMEFWRDAIRRELTGRAYELRSSESIFSDTGRGGTLMKFATESAGVDYRYLVALYVFDDRIAVGEAGGKAEDLDPREEQVLQTFRTIR